MNKTERKLLEAFDPSHQSMMLALKQNRHNLLRYIKRSLVLIVILLMSLLGYLFTKMFYFVFTSLFTTGSLIYLHGMDIFNYYRRRRQIIRYYEQN